MNQMVIRVLAGLPLTTATVALAQTAQIWGMHDERTIARIDLCDNSVIQYGTGMIDPANPTAAPGAGWVTLAVSNDRTIFLARRWSDDGVHMYSVPADGIQLMTVNEQVVISNLDSLGFTSLFGNVDGLTAGPDGNLYFAAVEVSGGPEINGIYRFKLATGATEFVGRYDPATNIVMGLDMTFDPISGDLVGSAQRPDGHSIFRIPRSDILTPTPAGIIFQWQYFGPAWAQFRTTFGELGDGIAFDQASGEMLLTGDDGGVHRMDRDTAEDLGVIPNTTPNPPSETRIGYDLDSRIALVPNSCYANCDQSRCSPVLNANDFICFIEQYVSQTPYANCDQSTVVPVLSANDFVCFLGRYASGCS